MDRETLKGLEQLNQLKLTDEQADDVLAFFADQLEERKKIEALDTSETVRMVHVMRMENVLRDDVARQDFTRDELQAGAPETMDGYWQVPRLVG